MRHRKHNHQLGVKSTHRISLVANLSSSLIEHGRIKTTLAKARALRPVIEKIITLAKKLTSPKMPLEKFIIEDWPLQKFVTRKRYQNCLMN